MRILLLSVGAGLFAFLAMDWGIDMLSPDWHTSTRRGAWLNDVPPVLRSGFFIGFGLLMAGAALALVRRAFMRRVAVFSAGGAEVHGVFSAKTVRWPEIERIELAYGGKSVVLVTAGEGRSQRVGVPASIGDTPVEKIIAAIAQYRPDLVPGRI